MTGIVLIVWLWCFYALYALVMGVYRAHLAQRLSRVAYALLAPFVALGFVVDVLTNITIATVLFAEPPRELLLTTRLQRYVGGSGGFDYINSMGMNNIVNQCAKAGKAAKERGGGAGSAPSGSGGNGFAIFRFYY